MRSQDVDEARRHRILVIDDDPAIAGIARELFSKRAYEIFEARSAAEGLRGVEVRSPDLVLLDHILPDGEGVDLLPEIIGLDRCVPVLFIAAEHSAANAIEAVKRGAFDYLPKPLSFERLIRQVDQALQSRRLLRAPVVLDGSESTGSDDADELIGRCDAMQRVYKAIGRNAASPLPVLIQGEPGTGKEVVARAIHRHSNRSHGPLQTIRCSDYEAAELEAVLFGVSPHDAGLLARSRGGTLVLEEIAAVSPTAQTRLLAQWRCPSTADRADGSQDPFFDVAFIFTTTGELESLLERRLVRSDLFYELRGNVIRLPPLRARGDDIDWLVHHYVRHFARIQRAFDAQPRVAEDAMAMLRSYGWPGNVAELKSVLRCAMAESGGTVLAGDYLREMLDPVAGPQESAADSPPRKAPERQTAVGPLPAALSVDWHAFVSAHAGREPGNLYAEAVEWLERGLLTEVLQRTRGNLAQAARQLGMTRVSLRKKIQTFGIPLPGRD